MRGTLSREVGQSVRLLLLSGATMAVYVPSGYSRSGSWDEG